MHFIWNGMNFFFNSIQSSSQCDIEEYHFCIWWNFERYYHFFLIQSNEVSHDKRLFSSRQRSYFQPNTISNNDSIVDFLLQQLFIFLQFEPSITFTFDSIIAILKSRQMNRLFLLINYIQSIESLGWRREGEKVSDKMKMNEIAFYQKVKLSM